MLNRSLVAKATLAAAVTIGACGRAVAPDESGLSRHTFAAPAMGTEFNIVLFAADSARAARAAAGAFALADSLESIMSDYRPDSELSVLSATAGSGLDATASEPLVRILLEARRVSERTGGAFDVTTGALTRLWRRGIRRNEVPPDSAIAAARATVGIQGMTVDSAAGRVRLERPGMRLDLGGIAKGYAADRMLDLLRSEGFDRALVDAGGDIAVGAPPPGAPGWRVAVSSGDPGSAVAGMIVVSNVGVATSGDTYRYVERDGRRYSHVVDPATGYGTTRTQTVTVLAASATLADAFASAFIVLLPLEAISVAESHPNLEARILSRSDSSHTPALYQTTGFPPP